MGATLNGMPRRTLRSRRSRSGLAQAVAILAKYGGSLWVADPAYTFTGSDGTGTAGDGSDAGYVRDLVGNARPLTQATTGFKPKLRRVSGRWAWVFDGVDDLLQTESLPAVSTETLVVAKYQPALTVTAAVHKGLTNSGALLYSSASTAIAMRIGSGTAYAYMSTVSPAPITFVQSGVFTSGASRLRSNGVQINTSAAAFASGANRLFVGSAASLFGQNTVYAAAYAPVAIPDAELLIIEKAMAQLAGVTI